MQLNANYLNKFEKSEHIISKMKYKGPKITNFNQSRRRLGKKPNLEKLLNPKSPLDSQKNK